MKLFPRSMLALSALSVVVAATAEAGERRSPAPGFYQASVFVVEASGPQNSCEFVAQTGQSYTGVFFYPGPRRSGANLRVTSATDNGPNVYIHEYSRTPDPGVNAWAGLGLEGFEGPTALYPTSFSANIVRLDESSFTMTMTVNVNVTANNVCSYGVNIALARTAPQY